jgi:transcriptional regulator with XRE-family HTH domain
MELVDFIIARRRACKWTQQDVEERAARAGFKLPAARVSQLESGRTGEFRAGRNSVASLAAGLGVPRGVIHLAAGVSIAAIEAGSDWDRLVDAWVDLPPVTEQEAGAAFLLPLGDATPAQQEQMRQRAQALIDAAEAKALALVAQAQEQAKTLITTAAQRARTGDEKDATSVPEPTPKAGRNRRSGPFLSTDALGLVE